MLKMLGGKKCEQRGEMRGYQRKEDKDSRASRGGHWQLLRYCSGKDAYGTQPAVSVGPPLGGRGQVAVGLHIGLHQVGSHEGQPEMSCLLQNPGGYWLGWKWRR